MSDLQLFQEAVNIDRGNVTALRKLATLEAKNGNYIAAALVYEKIRDYLETDNCYEQANSSAENYELKADYLVRRSLMKDIELAAENYMKAISHYGK